MELPPSAQALLEAIQHYTPITDISADQRQLINGSPESFIAALPIGLSLSTTFDESQEELFVDYFSQMANDLRIYSRSNDVSEIINIANEILTNALELDDAQINLMLTREIIRCMKHLKLHVDDAIIMKVRERSQQPITKQQEQLAQDPEKVTENLVADLNKFGVDTGLAFCQFVGGELIFFTEQEVQGLLTMMSRQPWSIDALLLLSLNPEPKVADSAASVLSSLPAKRWESLGQRQYLTLIQRFGHDSVKNHLPAWQKSAMQYSKQAEQHQVTELYLSYPDGNHAILFNGLLIDPTTKNAHVFGGVFRLGFGLVDSYFDTNPVDTVQYKKMTAEMDTAVDVVQCHPNILRHILCWALDEQHEVLDPDTLHMLALLPSQWTEPQPFSLDKLASTCDFPGEHPDAIARGHRSSKLLVNTPLIETWTIAESIDPALESIRKVRNRYYLEHPDPYIKALALSGLITHYSKQESTPFSPSNLFIFAAAYALQAPDRMRKTFPLFDQLTELSIQQQAEYHPMAHGPQEIERPQGIVLHIELDNSRPKIWRRFTISNALPFIALHDYIQAIMGWEHQHLAMFITPFGHIDLDDESDTQAAYLPIGAVLREPGDTIAYVYDFGDNWHHTITLEKLNTRNYTQPKVTAGNGVCPPEDCGGIDRYKDLLRLSKRAPLNDDDREILDLFNMQDWDAKFFDKNEVNQRLKEEVPPIFD
ncbi:plasmid pRiA4b ORF-3 family protein [Salinivibrio proteolyticus]|uniref:Plasmid pRiA4b ORF-3 family protein n=1 Tax=Salinivibrio proteolyticus TaxID=334715 RepID=A0ABY7LBP0_9GAMM|nr:plasmid pRiA4b ORF-3 family protein [Salinivibrio proteolyticus]WBA13919.1 plasmid pRiA4b ORF-3 family protein [Salinivibrio proteolyticus]